MAAAAKGAAAVQLM